MAEIALPLGLILVGGLAGFIIARRRMGARADTSQNRLSQRDTLALGALLLTVAIVQTVIFVVDPDTADIPLLVIWYGLTGWLVYYSLSTR